MDENLGEFSCVRKTQRWPLLVFFNMIDVAVNNGFIHIRREGYYKSKKDFIRNLSCELARPYAEKRHSTSKHLSKAATQAAQLFGYVPQLSGGLRATTTIGRCYVCSKVSRSRCGSCDVFVCPSHRFFSKMCSCINC
jgi:hypothetical protein